MKKKTTLLHKINAEHCFCPQVTQCVYTTLEETKLLPQSDYVRTTEVHVNELVRLRSEFEKSDWDTESRIKMARTRLKFLSERARSTVRAHLSDWAGCDCRNSLDWRLWLPALSLLLSGSHSSFQMFPLLLGLQQHLLQFHPLLFQLAQQSHLLLLLPLQLLLLGLKTKRKETVNIMKNLAEHGWMETKFS